MRRFILNGLAQANEILGEQVFKDEDWRVIGEYVYDGQGGRHQAFYSPVRDVHFRDVCFKAGERVLVERSFKYSAEEATYLWNASGLEERKCWSASSDAYSKQPLHLMYLLQLQFPRIHPLGGNTYSLFQKSKLRE